MYSLTFEKPVLISGVALKKVEKRRNQIELYSLSHLIPSSLVSPPSYRNIGEPGSLDEGGFSKSTYGYL